MSEKVICGNCNKAVYPLEAVTYDKTTYHKRCLKCTHCNGRVGLSSIASIEGKIYCKTHFVELFKQRGSYNDFKDGAADQPAFGSKRQSAPAVDLQIEVKPSAKADLEEADNKEKASPVNYSSDILHAVRMRNLKLLDSAIDKLGAIALFESDDNEETPIELAFTNDNSQSGRVMLGRIQEYIQSLNEKIATLESELNAHKGSKSKERPLNSTLNLKSKRLAAEETEKDVISNEVSI